jgi:hypothetical protein
VDVGGHPAVASFHFGKDGLWDVVVAVNDPGLSSDDGL